MKTLEEIERIKGMLENLCENYDKGLNFEYQADEFISEVELLLSQTKQELIEEIKKALPSHPDGMISRNEVKKILDRI